MFNESCRSASNPTGRRSYYIRYVYFYEYGFEITCTYKVLELMADWWALIFVLFTLSQTVNTLVIIASTVNAIFVHYFPSRSFEIISFFWMACIFQRDAMLVQQKHQATVRSLLGNQYQYFLCWTAALLYLNFCARGGTLMHNGSHSTAT